MRKPKRPSDSATISSGPLGPPDVATGVRDDDDLELQALRRMDGEQPHGTAALLLGDGFELLRAERVLVAHEADEALDVRSADRLVLAREPPELAEVREATAPVPAREHGEVVVVLAERSARTSLEPDPGGRAHEALVALEERAQQALVAGLEPFGKRALERGEERPARCVSAQQHERVVRDADERRREHGRERDVVVAVVQQPQVREQVDDLLLPEVAAAGRAEGRQAFAPERLLVALRVGACGEEHDDLSRLGLARVDELAHAARDRPRLAHAPVLRRVDEARLVGDEQLHRMAEHRVGELCRGGEGLVLVPERVAEKVVDRCEHLRARAVVAGLGRAGSPRLRGARGRPRGRRAGSRRWTGTRPPP